jgi:DNA-binding PadR family transcriptional regulator
MTNSELILLSLLAECPRHGYELEHVIEERGMRNWTEIAFSSIYFLLNKLVRDGLATFSTQPAQGRGPAKKVYKATKAGRLALKQGVRAGLANPQPGSRDFMFALSCLPLLASEEVLASLQIRRLALLARHSELQQHPALTQPGFPPHVKAMFTYSLPLLQAELEWLEQLILEIQNGVFQNGKN